MISWITVFKKNVKNPPHRVKKQRKNIKLNIIKYNHWILQELFITFGVVLNTLMLFNLNNTAKTFRGFIFFSVYNTNNASL